MEGFVYLPYIKTQQLVWIRPERVPPGRTQPELLKPFGFEKLNLLSWIINCHSISPLKQNIKQASAQTWNGDQKSFLQRTQNWDRYFMLSNVNCFILPFCLPSVLISGDWQLMRLEHHTEKLISARRGKTRIIFWWKISSFGEAHAAAVRTEKVWRY